jgi:hypothetical protein
MELCVWSRPKLTFPNNRPLSPQKRAPEFENIKSDWSSLKIGIERWEQLIVN